MNKARIAVAACAALALALPASSMASVDVYKTCTDLGLGSGQTLDLGAIGTVTVSTCSRVESVECEREQLQLLIPGVIRTTVSVCKLEELT